MTVDELVSHLRTHGLRIREALLAGTYRPLPVKRQEIPKKTGGVRLLGIPTVLDRVMQQALLQVLQRRFDPTFSEHSYGFRPGRSAQQAIAKAQRYVSVAFGAQRWWHHASLRIHQVLTNAHFDQLGVPRLAA